MNEARETPAVDEKIRRGAHHESGHLVIAAAQGLVLRPEGISVDIEGNGLACYCKQPEDSDLSRERVIITSFAGFVAEKAFCGNNAYPVPDPTRSLDWQEAAQIVDQLSNRYIANESLRTIMDRLVQRSEQLVAQHWPTIGAVAASVLDKTPGKPPSLKSGGKLSDVPLARNLSGEEAVKLLEPHGIAARCDPNCEPVTSSGRETLVALEYFHRHFVITHFKKDASNVVAEAKKKAAESGISFSTALAEKISSKYSEHAYQDDNWYLKEVPLDTCYFAHTDFRLYPVPKDQRFIDFMQTRREEIELGTFPCSYEIRYPITGSMPEPLAREREPGRYYILDGQLRIIRHWYHGVSKVKLFVYRGPHNI